MLVVERVRIPSICTYHTLGNFVLLEYFRQCGKHEN